MPTLPTIITPGDIGHIDHHERLHLLTNPVQSPFGIPPLLVEDLFADRPAAGQEGRLFAAKDTGDYQWDDGTDWRPVTASSPPVNIVFVDDLTARNALTPLTDTVAIVRGINRMYRYNGSRWVAQDEAYGINIVDYGALGTGSFDDRPAIVAAAGVAVSTKCRTVIFPTPPTIWAISSALDPMALIGVGSTWVGKGGSGGTPGIAFNYNRIPIVNTSGGAVFEPSNSVSGVGAGQDCTIENLTHVNSPLFHNKPTHVTTDPWGDARFRLYNCGGQAAANGTANDACVILEKTFWVDIERCDLTGPTFATTTTSSTTLSASPFTMNVGSTAGMPSSGEVAIGAFSTSSARVVSYTGKTSTTLTGCTTVDTGTFSSGAAVRFAGAPVIIRAGSATYGAGVSYLVRMKECIFGYGGVRFEMNAGKGSSVYDSGEITMEDVTIENSYSGTLDVINNSGGAIGLKNPAIRRCFFHDNAAPDSATGANTALRLRGADYINIENAQIHTNDQINFDPPIYMTHASSIVRGHVSGLILVGPSEAGSAGSFDHLIVEGRSSCTIYHGLCSAPQVGWFLPNTNALFGHDSAGTPAELVNLYSDDVLYLGTYSGNLNRQVMLRANGQEFLRGKDNGGTKQMGFFGATPINKPAVGAAATDAATTQTLANNLRTALINLGLATT